MFQEDEKGTFWHSEQKEAPKSVGQEASPSQPQRTVHRTKQVGAGKVLSTREAER